MRNEANHAERVPAPDDSPFHSGERAVQARLGVEEVEQWARQVVRDFLPSQHRDFYSQQPFLVAAARDEEGNAWATLLEGEEGEEGFVTSPDERSLRIAATPRAGDPLAGAWRSGADVGLLGIEFATRRRNRVNGRIGAEGDAIEFAVDQTFGNCPQYIRPRGWTRVHDVAPQAARRSRSLDEGQRAWIEGADTFFIASGYRGDGEHAHYGMDASHRGGPPGFVEVEDDVTLVFPDYSGNRHFNTIGNLTRDARVGLLFIDFASGHLLQLSGRAEIIWDGPALTRFSGAERLVRVRVERVVEQRDATASRWHAPDAVPRSLVVVDKLDETEDVSSFVLADASGGALPDFVPGQHLPIRVTTQDGAEPEERTYSLSDAPNGRTYRISVKRHASGRVSRALHDGLRPGDRLEVSPPSGDFVLDPERFDLDHTIVLMSAGVGVTPVLAMLKSLAGRASAGQPVPRVVWVHGARDGRHHALAAEAVEAGTRLPKFRRLVAYSQPRAEDRPGIDFGIAGRLDRDRLAKALGERPTAAYLCGPPAFLAEARGALEQLGVDTDDIDWEQF